MTSRIKERRGVGRTKDNPGNSAQYIEIKTATFNNFNFTESFDYSSMIGKSGLNPKYTCPAVS